MKKIVFIATMLIAAVATSAQEVIKSTEIGDFQAITLAGNIAVELVSADTNGIEISLYESTADRFRWSVSEAGVLSVYLRPTVGKNSRADVRIHYKADLQDITVNEARLTATKLIEAHHLHITLSGGASANLAIKAKDLELEAKGNSVIAANGEAKYLTIRASERSKIEVKTLSSTSAEVTATMGAEVFVDASERLVALTRSGATIYHTGSPEILKNLSLRGGLGGGVFSIGEPLKR
jgi:hypothetical protein